MLARRTHRDWRNGCSSRFALRFLVFDERGILEKYGFAYGTLEEHREIGEERFTVEFNSSDGSVWYDLYAFSRPGPAASLAYPFSRSLQKRFAKESKEAMQRAVQSS